MRKNIVAGNWKMNTTLPEGLALAKGLDEALKLAKFLLLWWLLQVQNM